MQHIPVLLVLYVLQREKDTKYFMMKSVIMLFLLLFFDKSQEDGMVAHVAHIKEMRNICKILV